MNGDIMPFNAPLGGHTEIRSYARIAVPTLPYGYGEWVVLDANGVLDGLAEATADIDLTAITVNTHFIAATPFVKLISASDVGEGQIRLDRVGDTRFVSGPNTSVLDSVYSLDWNTEFITRFLFTADTDTLATPVATNIGDSVGPHHSTTDVAGTIEDRHGVGLGGLGLVITRVLDATKTDIQLSGRTGVYTVFRRSV
jgi:hypothetical protein